VSKQNWGFTLIELMIVIAIVSILAAVSFGAYSSYVLKANRTDGRATLSDTAARLEKCKAIYGGYDKTNCDSVIPTKSPEELYNITENRGATTFTLTATATGRQAGDTKCATMTLTNTGLKDGTGTDKDVCW